MSSEISPTLASTYTSPHSRPLYYKPRDEQGGNGSIAGQQETSEVATCMLEGT